MKKYALLLIPIILTLVLIACDFSPEGSSSKNDSIDESSENSKASNSSQDNDVSDKPEISSDFTEETATDEKTFTGITVKVIGTESLKNAGYTADSSFSMTVDVTLKGDIVALDVLDPSEISASIDVSSVLESGDVELLIEFTAPEGLEIVSASENFATINIKKASTEITPPSVDEVRIVNGVLISGTRAMEQFGGSASNGAKTAAKLNSFKEVVGEDVNVYVLPAPLASAFYAPVGYTGSIKAHQNCFYGMRDALVDVGFVDTISALSAHVDEDIYFRTDHHWQALAAYYCCEELARVAGTPFDHLSTFEKHSADGVLGSFYTTWTKDAVLKNNPDTMYWYVPTRNHTVEYYTRDNYKNPVTGRTLFAEGNSYSKFVYGDSYTTHVKTNVGNGRKILVFKDSYGNALAPFLVGSFDEIYIADYRYFKLDVSDFIEQEGITDVCFSLAAFAVNNSGKIKITY